MQTPEEILRKLKVDQVIEGNCGDKMPIMVLQSGKKLYTRLISNGNGLRAVCEAERGTSHDGFKNGVIVTINKAPSLGEKLRIVRVNFNTADAVIV